MVTVTILIYIITMTYIERHITPATKNRGRPLGAPGNKSLGVPLKPKHRPKSCGLAGDVSKGKAQHLPTSTPNMPCICSSAKWWIIIDKMIEHNKFNATYE